MQLPTNGQWTLVTTTTVDTIMQARKSRVLITTIDPATGDFDPNDSAIELTDHVQLRGLFVVPAGLSVWASCVSAAPDGTCNISFMPWGVAD
jgi:hypothetical protein